MLDLQRKKRIEEERKIQEAREEADEKERKQENAVRRAAMQQAEDIERRAAKIS